MWRGCQCLKALRNLWPSTSMLSTFLSEKSIISMIICRHVSQTLRILESFSKTSDTEESGNLLSPQQVLASNARSDSSECLAIACAPSSLRALDSTGCVALNVRDAGVFGLFVHPWREGHEDLLWTIDGIPVRKSVRTKGASVRDWNSIRTSRIATEVTD